jgi:hypothetical protein
VEAFNLFIGDYLQDVGSYMGTSCAAFRHITKCSSDQDNFLLVHGAGLKRKVGESTACAFLSSFRGVDSV